MSERAGTRRIAGGNRGFTLIEVLVALGLLVLVLGLLLVPMWSGYAFMEKGNARAEALAAAREALDSMSRELAEAIYVFDPPQDRSMVAFYLGAGAQPAPQEVDGQPVAIRYWRALRDPARAYEPFWNSLGTEWNPYFVARAEIPRPQFVPTPGDVEDTWNNTATWGRPTVRALFVYPDNYVYAGATWLVSQPGWPWLEAWRRYPAAGQVDSRYQWYQDHATGLTPDSQDYDVTQLTFSPSAVGNEALAPLRPGGRWPPDYSVYCSRWPLWCHFSLEASASGLADRIDIYDESGARRYFAVPTPRDVSGGQVVAWAGDVCIYRAGANPESDDPIFNCERYPNRQGAEYAFGIDYDHGRLLYAFTAARQSVANGGLQQVGTANYILTLASGLTDGYVLDGSDQVQVDGIYYHRVRSDPGAGQYQLVYGDAGEDGDGDREWYVAFDPAEPPTGTVVVSYRYRNPCPSDLVVANYQTKSRIEVDLTVAKRDKAGKQQQEPRPGFYPTRQEAHLGVTVKLHNVVK